MMRTLLQILAAVAWFAVVFVVGFHLFFPSDAALQRIRWEVGQRSGGDWTLEAASASPWRVTGLALSDARLLSVEKKRPVRRSRIQKDDAAEPPVDPPGATATPVLTFDRLAGRLRLGSILHATPDIGFAADLYGGDVTGHARVADDRTVLAFDLDGVDLSRVPIGGKTWKVEAEGEVRARAEFDIDAEETRGSTGTFRLVMDDLVLRSGNVAGVTLPSDTIFTKAILAIEIKDGKGAVTEGTFASSLFDATLDGDITLNKRFTRSRLRLELTLTLQESLDALVRILPTARDARDEEGTYHFVVSGTLSSPRIRGNYNRKVSPTRRIPMGRSGFDEGSGPGFQPGMEFENGPMDDDQRRQEREERLKERRERLKERRETSRRTEGVPQDGDEGPRTRRPLDRMEDEPDDRREREDYPPDDEDLPPDDEDLPPEEGRYPPPYPEEFPPFEEQGDLPPFEE